MKIYYENKWFEKSYEFDYEELYNEKENCVEIKAYMKIDLNSKAAKNKLYRSWKKDKSPLLTQLQENDKNHRIDLKEGKTSLSNYNIEEFEKYIETQIKKENNND